MKNLRIVIAILTVSLFATNSAFSQADVFTEDIPIAIFVDCANDGAGELASGVITVHFVERDGSFVAHPQGGTLIGQVTGIPYRATGVTKESSGNNGFTFVNRFHFVGKGTQFFIKQTAHVTVNANGDITASFSRGELICK